MILTPSFLSIWLRAYVEIRVRFRLRHCRGNQDIFGISRSWCFQTLHLTQERFLEIIVGERWESSRNKSFQIQSAFFVVFLCMLIINVTNWYSQHLLCSFSKPTISDSWRMTRIVRILLRARLDWTRIFSFSLECVQNLILRIPSWFVVDLIQRFEKEAEK
jgi:hypothetical protein